jgi:hypothetical protein
VGKDEMADLYHAVTKILMFLSRLKKNTKKLKGQKKSKTNV